MTLAAAAETGLGAFRPSSLRPGTRRESSVCAAAVSADRAFEARRRATVSAGDRAPLERVAAFLISISRNNRNEGRDPTAIPESLTCGFVADLLGFPIDRLAAILRTLEDRGLVTADPTTGLRLKDLAALGGLAA